MPCIRDRDYIFIGYRIGKLNWLLGNAEIWLKTHVQFANAMQKLQTLNALNGDFIRLGNLSQRYGKALEQEAIWFSQL